jgi:hypothetical protein
MPVRAPEVPAVVMLSDSEYSSAGRDLLSSDFVVSVALGIEGST